MFCCQLSRQINRTDELFRGLRRGQKLQVGKMFRARNNLKYDMRNKPSNLDYLLVQDCIRRLIALGTVGSPVVKANFVFGEQQRKPGAGSKRLA